MTRKDFELIARCMRAQEPRLYRGIGAPNAQQWIRDCMALADMCAGTNPRFDRAKFLIACGIPA
jgi:hypothetical protein